MLKYLPELLKDNVITQETADKIVSYYQSKKKQNLNLLFLIFGVLGALLVGLGIILIVAHNWDDLPKKIKIIFAFFPLILSQLICGFVLLKKSDQNVWRESASTFLLLSIGSCISLISQIYHISGDLSSFFLIWMCLSLPVFYLMNSSFVSLLYLEGITYYSCECGYWSYPTGEPYFYWLLLVLAVPYIVKLIKEKPESLIVRFHYLFFVLSVIISLGTLAKGQSEMMYLSYFNVFGIVLLLGQVPYFQHIKSKDKLLTIIGFMGTMVLLFITSFKWIWIDMFHKHHLITDSFAGQEMIPFAITTITGIYLLFRKYRTESLTKFNPLDVAFLFFIPVFFIAYSYPNVGVILVNLLILIVGVYSIVKGYQNSHLGTLNLGLAILAILITCRFFDTNFSFLTRGILFVAVGLGFFFTNYYMLKKTKNNEH